MSDWKTLNQGRVRKGPYQSKDSDGFNGEFFITVNGMMVRCIASDGEGWRHVSVSLVNTPHFTPSWDIMCKVKELFWEPDAWVIQYHPPKTNNINIHPGCLHLWEPTGVELPKPDPLMV